MLTSRFSIAGSANNFVDSKPAIAMRDITELMNSYRECSRNLWNVYFSKRKDIGDALDVFEQIRELLFDSIVLSELSYEGEAEGGDIPPPALRIVPQKRTLILIQRSSAPGEAGYWDQEKDMLVGPEDITLAFLDYFDFWKPPMMDFRYFRCRVLSFPSHPDYKGREALLEASNAQVFHDESAEKR